MGNLWLRIKVWTKVTVFVILIVYFLAFVFKNSDQSAEIWYWFLKDKYKFPVLFMTFFVFMAGVVGTILVSTTFKTIRQVRELQQRTRAERLEREVTDMKTKAAMLQTRPPTGAQASAPTDVSEI